MMAKVEEPFLSWYLQFLQLIGYGRWTPCSYFRSSPLVQGSSYSEKSHKLSGKHATESSFSEYEGKLWQLASLLKTYNCVWYFPGAFQGNNTALAQIYSPQSLGSIVNIVVLVDAPKASGWKIEFQTWHTVPIRNAKSSFCKIICFIFLKLLMKIVQSYLYPKAHIPLCLVCYPVNKDCFFLNFFIWNLNLRTGCIKSWINIALCSSIT